MKKALSVLMIIALIAFLCACSSPATSSSPTASSSSAASSNSATASETSPSVSQPSGFEEIGGTWEVGAFYYESEIIDIHDHEALEGIYDTTRLTFNEDGSYVYFDKFCHRGTWSKNDDEFRLNAKESFRYGFEKGEFTPVDVKESERQFIVKVLDENTLSYIEADPSTGAEQSGEDPLFFVRQGEESTYIQSNKTPLNSSSSKTSGTQKTQSASTSKDTGSYKANESYSTPSRTQHANATTGEKNALDRAQRYLEYTSFSRKGLIDQLEYEGYSTSEATYGVDNCGANWKEQAVLKAKQYLDYTSFSRSGLKDQLLYEGFTDEEAEYGVNQAY